MRLVSFEAGGTRSYGVMDGDRVRDAGAELKSSYPSLKDALEHLDELAAAAERAPTLDLEAVKLLPPIDNAGRIVCIGLNYKSHIAETGRDAPAYPILFPRYPDSLVGHDSPLVRPHVSETFDFEGELAVVIGKTGRYVSADDAMEHVAGYACFNDGSIRAYQRHTSQFMPGKCFWRSGSFGPWLVTGDEVPDPAALHLQTRLNGEVMQDTGVDDLLFDVPALIVYLSEIWPLQVGDVIATGTTGGVGAFRKPPVWMKPGDKVEVEITDLGTLTNTVIDE